MKKIKRNVVVFVLVLIIACTSFADRVIYVDDDATGANDGSSWEDAYTYLQNALADADSVEKHALSLSNGPVEIRVAQGTYKADRGGGRIPGDIEVSFQLIDNVIIKGGYAGLGEPDPNERDTELYETILSGDLNEDDIDINEPSNFLHESTRYENSDHVVTGSNTNETAVLDGFTITGGSIWIIFSIDPRRGGSGSPSGGAGMLISSGSPTIIDCTFTDNVTGNIGGGLLIYNGGPTLINCTFTKNYAAGGGGISTWENSSPTLIDCTFSNNFGQHGSGGMSSNNSNPTLNDCIFIGNTTGSNAEGGGMTNYNSNPVLTNCSFVENSAYSGGAMYNEDSNSMLNTCEFIGNSASRAGAISNDAGQLIADECIFDKNYEGAIRDYSEICSIFTNCKFGGNSTSYIGGAVYTYNATFTRCIFAGNRSIGGYGGAVFSLLSAEFKNCTFVNNWAKHGSSIYSYLIHVNNCIFWGNDDQICPDSLEELLVFVNYSNIQGGWEGEGNVDVDPLFTNSGYWADIDDPNIVSEPNDPNAVWVEGDYHLKSQAGRYDPNSQSWVIDDVTSPCIDAGDPNRSVGDEPLPNGGIINMGAYGGTTEASKSYFPE